jgi:hypothetical protein
MNGEHKIRSVWKLSVAVVVAVALLAGFLWWELKSPTLVARAPVATPLTDSRSLTPGPLASTISASKPSARPTAATGAEICGIGPAPVSVDPADINNYVEAKTRAARDRWEAALLNSADLHARAVGLLLQSGGELVSRESAVKAAEARDELVQLAAGGNDPLIYSLALEVCRAHRSTVRAAVAADTDVVTISQGEEGSSDISSSSAAANSDITASPGACTRLSLSQWARLDPDNAAPWLTLAQAAHEVADATSEASDMEHAAQAQKIENPGELLLSLARSEMPPDLSPLEKSATAIEFIGYEAASVGPLVEPRRYCTANASQQSKIHAQCDALATLLVDHGQTLLEFSLGQRLGAEMGWSQQRLSELAQERTTLIRLFPDEGANPWSCETVSRENAFFEKRMELGEMQALRYFKPKPP